MTAPLLMCPRCGSTFERLGAIDEDEGEPQHGAVTVCVRCLAPLRFVAGLVLVALSDAELDALDGIHRAGIRTAQHALRSLLWTHPTRRPELPN